MASFTGSTEFCAAYPNAVAECPDTCNTGRRLLTKTIETRRKLQQVFSDGSESKSFATTVGIKPSKASIIGHVDDTSPVVRFTMKMTVNEHMINNFDYDRPTFYRTMEFELAHLSTAANAQQMQCVQISRTKERGKDALVVVVEIERLNVEEESLLPSNIASNLENKVRSGKIYDNAFFTNTEVFSMEFHEVSEDQGKVHFGPMDEFTSEADYEASAAVFSFFLIFVSSLLFW